MKTISPFGFKLVGMFIGIIATLMILFPALGLEDASTTYTGVQISLGHEFASLGSLASGQIEFSILNLVAFALPLVAALMLMFTKRGYLLSAIIFGIATVMLFLVPEFTKVTVTVLDTVNEVTVDWTYGVGLIIAGILSAVGVLTSLFGMMTKR